MPKPLSIDLRKRIIEDKLRGDTEEKIASDKSVHKSTVTKLCSLFRKTGSYGPRPNHNGRKPKLSGQQMEQVRETIVQCPDITLQELIDKFSLPVSISALSKIIRIKMKFRFKKKRYVPLNSSMRKTGSNVNSGNQSSLK
jgi:transposase